MSQAQSNPIFKTNRLRFLVYLHSLPSMTRALLHKIAKSGLEPEQFFVHPSLLLEQFAPLLSEERYLQLRTEIIKVNTAKIDQIFYTNKIGVLEALDPAFPIEFLQSIRPKPPPLIYYRGELEVLNRSEKIGIVGTRKPSHYGRQILSQFLNNLPASEALAVVSGGAYGIDILALREADRLGIPTVTVLGSGLANVYPKSHHADFQKFTESGLVISEYFPDFAATLYSFPERNRLVAALSKVLFVVEAPQKSGALITANIAFHDYCKTIIAVPGRLDDPLSAGTNKLIALQIAKLYLNPETILTELDLPKLTQTSSRKIPADLAKYLATANLEVEAKLILADLAKNKQHLDTLIGYAPTKTEHIIGLMSYLLLLGIVIRDQNGYFTLKSSNALNFFDSS